MMFSQLARLLAGDQRSPTADKLLYETGSIPTAKAKPDEGLHSSENCLPPRIVIGEGETTDNAIDFALFESIGNNCEFGIVQRKAGYDSPGLFRNVGYNNVDQIINGISQRFDKMFSDEAFNFNRPDGFPDWKLNCEKFGYGFHSNISTQIEKGTDQWALSQQSCITVHRYLLRKILNDLDDGTKIFVYRSKTAPRDDEIIALQRAIRRHGRGWLLVVREDRTAPNGAVILIREGLLIGSINRLSNENPPQIDHEAWQAIMRTSSELRSSWIKRVPHSPGLRAAGQSIPMPPGLRELRLLIHALDDRIRGHQCVHRIDIEVTAFPGLCTVDAWIYLPKELIATDISLVLLGNRSTSFKKIELLCVETWQHISVTAEIPEGQRTAAPTLTISSDAGTALLSTGWRIRAQKA